MEINAILAEAKQKIQESEERFRVMSDYAPVAIWMSGTNSLCDFFNLGWLQFTGRTMEQELGLGWADGVHPEDFQHTIDTYLNAFNKRVNFSMYYRLRRFDGEFRWMLDNGVPRYLPDGTFVGYIGSCTDVTDQKNKMIELSDTLKQRDQALQMRDDLLSILSHELKTPLTPLKIYLQTIKMHIPKVCDALSEESLSFSEAVENMDRQVDHILKLINTMLDAACGTFEKLILHVEKVNLVEVVHCVLERYKFKKDDSLYKLTYSSNDIFGQWDRLRIDQIIDNLVNNAIKYGQNKPIEICLSQSSSQTALIIRDQGIGIPRNAQTSIFNRFERAVSGKHYGGLGLGLYIAKENVLLHKGTITVESDIGEGATFTVTLPNHC
ncbi:MAG: PAS domain-containing sensor histidine kinase [Gammaproteobacteria bacterium]|nr:PAS domain-containing sensor histidine kinase [Gammaproteobacteria bacterium]